jgi:hypothetical protein
VEMLYFRVVLGVLRTAADCVVGLMALATVEVLRSGTKAKSNMTWTCGIRVAVGHGDESPLHTRTVVLDCYKLRDADHLWLARCCKRLVCRSRMYRRVLLIGSDLSHGAYREISQGFSVTPDKCILTKNWHHSAQEVCSFSSVVRSLIVLESE